MMSYARQDLHRSSKRGGYASFYRRILFKMSAYRPIDGNVSRPAFQILMVDVNVGSEKQRVLLSLGFFLYFVRLASKTRVYELKQRSNLTFTSVLFGSLFAHFSFLFCPLFASFLFAKRVSFLCLLLCSNFGYPFFRLSVNLLL